MTGAYDFLVESLRRVARPLAGTPRDWDAVVDRVGDARIVLLGEGSHGTHEFYRARAEITRRLVEEKGFRAVAVEADWPDAWRVDRYVRARPGADADATDALGGFRRFPQWMWRNADVLDFVGWLRARNDRNVDDAAGFYGLDLYSLFASIEQVLGYLGAVDPDAARRARARYGCFEQFGDDTQDYGRAVRWQLAASCESAVVEQLVEMLHRNSAARASEDLFSARMNARLVANAEAYYRTMFGGRVSSWNLRDTHMADTLDELADFTGAKIVVWAHNSHLGDARATEMHEQGELNLGQLVRERWPGAVVSVGFTTHHGTVTAASDWDQPADRKRVRPALSGSVEELFHDVGLGRFVVVMNELGEASGALAERRLERAIGVVYRPETERWSHYFHVRLPAQFDVVAHFDETRAVEPLEHEPRFTTREAPETFPSAV